MSQSLQTMSEAKAFAAQCIESLPCVIGKERLEESRAQMMLAFSRGASPDLYRCSRNSIGYAIALSAMTGLYPGGPMPDVWLIPRRNRGVLEANWQISARGYVRLARRTGHELDVALVFQGERFAISRGTNPGIVHEPDVDRAMTWDDLRLGYAITTTPDGRRLFAHLRKDQIEKRRARAETQKIWQPWWEEMSLKTVAAYAGRRELFPCDSPTRYAIAADVTGQPGEVLATKEAPALLAASDFEEPGCEPGGAPGADVEEPAKPVPLSDADRQQFLKALRAKDLEEAAIDACGVPDTWTDHHVADLNRLLRGGKP